METTTSNPAAHSSAWIAQVWISFAVAVGGLLMGIFYLPVSMWARAFLAMGVLLVVNSSTALAKTVRDVHEEQKLVNRVDTARVTKLITENDPMAI